MISHTTIQLLKDIIATESPSTRKEIIMQFCIMEGKDNDSNELMDLINAYQIPIDKKKGQGKLAHKNDRSNKKKIKVYKHPKFFLVFNGHGICEVCKHPINKGSPAFFHRTGDISLIYCPTPSCFPEEHKDNMLSDKDFIAWSKPKNDIQTT
jgi:hypothetical protein